MTHGAPAPTALRPGSLHARRSTAPRRGRGLEGTAHYAGDVTSGRDDDALSWDGDDDPTLDVGSAPDPASASAEEAPSVAMPEHEPAPPAEPQTVALPEGFTAVGKGSETLAGPQEAASATRSDVVEETAADEKAPMGSAELIALGVLGGVYALFAIGWIIGGLRLQGWRPFLVTDAMYQGSLWLAVLAPLLWFTTVFLLTRTTRAWVRFAWLAAGVVLLVPWPFVLIGAVGQ